MRAASGSSQGRKPDDERHRLRRGRPRFQRNRRVTRTTRLSAQEQLHRTYKIKVQLYAWSHRLTVRTPGSHPGNPGSIPGEITKIKYSSMMGILFCHMSRFWADLLDYQAVG